MSPTHLMATSGARYAVGSIREVDCALAMLRRRLCEPVLHRDRLRADVDQLLDRRLELTGPHSEPLP